MKKLIFMLCYVLPTNLTEDAEHEKQYASLTRTKIRQTCSRNFMRVDRVQKCGCFCKSSTSRVRAFLFMCVECSHPECISWIQEERDESRPNDNEPTADIKRVKTFREARRFGPRPRPRFRRRCHRKKKWNSFSRTWYSTEKRLVLLYSFLQL